VHYSVHGEQQQGESGVLSTVDQLKVLLSIGLSMERLAEVLRISRIDVVNLLCGDSPEDHVVARVIEDIWRVVRILTVNEEIIPIPSGSLPFTPQETLRWLEKEWIGGLGTRLDYVRNCSQKIQGEAIKARSDNIHIARSNG
jgi:hypothetical protein